MKTGQMAVAAGLAVVAAGIWAGRAVWTAQRGMVTLHVKNAPLAEVARTIEGQVHQKIRVDPKLDAKVTLEVKNLPLTNALDLLAEQAGARWGKTYAVYGSADALGRLEDAFTGSSTLDAAGWTNVAPHFDKPELPPINLAGDGPGPRRIVVNAPEGSGGGERLIFQKVPNDPDPQKMLAEKGKGGVLIANTEDVSEGPTPGGGAGRDGRGSGQGEKRVMVRVARGPGGATTTTTTTMDGDGERVSVTKTSPDGKILQQDDWSPERLVMETSLAERLSDAAPEKATRETAEQAAAKVKGELAVYYGMEKPPLGGVFRRPVDLGKLSGKGGTNNPMAAVEAARKANLLGGMGTLSPEQQVQRARQMQEAMDANK